MTAAKTEEMLELYRFNPPRDALENRVGKESNVVASLLPARDLFTEFSNLEELVNSCRLLQKQ